MSFKHLGLSGLIPGTYTGVNVPAAVPGVNVPAGPFKNSGYSIAHTSIPYYGEIWGPSSIGNFLFFGAPSDIMRLYVLKPAEISSIDVKIDDGLPHLGIVQPAQLSSGCTTGTSAPTTYALTLTTIVCAVKYRL